MGERLRQGTKATLQDDEREPLGGTRGEAARVEPEVCGEAGESQSQVSNNERLDQLEANHVRLMTEHEMEVRRNGKAWKRHRRFVREVEARRVADDARWAAYREEQKQREEALDARIEKLVSGIGAFIGTRGETR
jgi:hypothetical protein